MDENEKALIEMQDLKRRIGTLEKNQERIRHSLDGNGAPGLKVQINTLMNDVKRVNTWLDKFQFVITPSDYKAHKEKLAQFDPSKIREMGKNLGWVMKIQWLIIGGLILLNTILFIFKDKFFPP